MTASTSRRRFDITHDSGFVEIADRCWVARHELVDVNVGLVGGTRGLVVIDTHASSIAARAVIERIRDLRMGEVVAVVNTHAHWDHVLGNATFVEEYDGPPVVAHEETARTLRDAGGSILDAVASMTDITGTSVFVPDDPFSSARVIDLGDRLLEVVHPGRGHTGGDAIISVADAGVLYAGDLVEESAAPSFGDDCYPLEWPVALDLMVGLLSEDSVVVPGHGLPVDRDFVMDQRASISVVAESIRDLASRGTRPDQMAEAAEWPYPAEQLSHAFTRGFEQLPRSSRNLPLL
ncbi:MAG TPA: MBL fold metallo-hydrolase [Nocardioidaceae bacterium]|nr:MBL fold metallo-hydrolase [Nocardioidaceae bacterium]